MDPAKSARGRDYTVWWFLSGAALVTVLFYRDFIFHADRLLYGSDMLFEGISLRRFYVDEILAGRGVPLWVPHVYGGMPFVAILPGPIFYPSTILYFLLPLSRAIGWTFVLHTFLNGAFGYFLGRSFRLRPASSVVCGASFLLAGYVTSHLFGGQDGRMFTMTLIPLALGLLNRGLERNEFRWFAGLAFVIAAQTFSAHVQMMYFSCLALAAFFLYHVAFRLPRPDSGEAVWRVYARPVAWFTLANVAAVLIAAPQFFPTLTVLEHVTRAAGERGYEFAASWALPPQELPAVFLRDLIGSLPGSYWGQNPIKLHTEYLGAVTIALAILGLSAGFGRSLDRDHRRVVWFLAGASFLGVLFALGAATPVHRIAYTLLPMMSSLRAPSMMLGPVTVFVALLAAYGWEAVLIRRAAGTDSDDGAEGNAAARRLSWPVLLLG
ncbi:MAG: YfhO family protein, partial [Gemmatimonadales bacterium]|nr:YfhO family protein [Gemmatimonadales bacterium]